MSEAYSWTEGTVSIFTGNGSTSAVVSYCQSIQTQFAYQWQNTQSLSGVYRDHLVGQNASVVIGAFWADQTFIKLSESATAVHMKILNTNAVNGSAGWYLYSGRIDAIPVQGGAAGVMQFSVQYHANRWSAF